MPGQSPAPAIPLSTHARVHLLVSPEALPRVSADLIDGQRTIAGEAVFLQVEAEHRSLDFDHTASFTVSGSRTAIDRLLLRLRAAFASLPAAAGDEPGERQ
jgi:hypothetical protein